MSDASIEKLPTRVPRKYSVLSRLGMLAVTLFAAWHIFASFLWISPPSELRTVVPGNLLSSYMLPWFGQSWSVFAPEPINGDYKLLVRAIVADAPDGGSESTYSATEWVDATQVELSMSQYNLFPPRAAILSTQQATKLLNLWKTLKPEQKDITALGYYEGDAWLARMREALNEYGDERNVTNYIVQERYTTAYATQVAYAVWGENAVTQVQFQVSRQNIIPFEERNNPSAERPEPVIADTGWRGTIVLEGQSTADFAETFNAHYRGGRDD
ncbi:DUF5819 family protein [Microbacterium sp. KSW4-16]|uniref:DUF5819 family protein n=1 Tax=Microbacterium aurugineum TaxID=2851642 RepID=UPI0020BD84D4|nr:DUF5819 family protein [Microbacterium aurugineum]MCK8469052.1 DUF5819 family protein [Microbacterium aurugineum]